MAAIRATAFAKINLTLQILGVRHDGYHELDTTFQTLALHDTLTFTPSRGAFEIWCNDPACPVDATNLVWRAAEQVWRAAGRRGVPAGVGVRLVKRIPFQAGLGGGSSDAAAALRALAKLWRVRLSEARLARIAAGLGADVPFFLHGGTAFGAGRGDRLRPLGDWPAAWVVLALPGFGVSTKDAYDWWDADWGGAVKRRSVLDMREHSARGSSGRARVTEASGGRAPRPLKKSARAGPYVDLRNDLEAPVSARHPEIARIVAWLKAAGARHAAMSGSGSAVFGFFTSLHAAAIAARALSSPTRRTIVTRTLSRKEYRTLARPR